MPLSLENFTIQEVAEYGEWEEWCQVRDARPPDDRWLPHEDRLKQHKSLRRDDLQGPTPEFDRKQQLGEQFETRIRGAFREGCWRVTGRIRGMPPRVEIEPHDLQILNLDLRRGRMGDYRDVEISRITLSHQQFLQQQIEALCKNVMVGESLRREVIETILRSMFPDQFSIDHFRAAWKDARIDDGWRKPGRRGGSA